MVEVDLKKIAMQPVWHMVLFDTDEHGVDNRGAVIVDAVVEQLRLLSDAAVHVMGNTDRAGSKGYNQVLSTKRENSVTEALIAAGVPARWITSEAFGMENPISISSNVHDALNRRVDIAIEPVALNEEAVRMQAEKLQDERQTE